MAEQVSKKRILILLSAYNGEKYIGEQLNSLFALGGDFEFTIRVRDDGSSDSTPAILAAYGRERGVEVINGENVGFNASFFALMEGAEETYDYYALCDQDDVWLPGKFERAVPMLEKENAAQPLLYSGVLCLTGEDLSGKRTLPYPKRGPSFYNAMIQDICSGHTMVFNAALLRLLKGSYREGLMNYDHWIYLAASSFGKVIYDSEPQVLYRQHGENAVGAQDGFFKKTARRLRYLKQARGGAMARQLAAFYEAFGGSLREEYRQEISDFLASGKNFCSRIKYACKSRAVRQSGAETLLFRLLYVFGKFKA